MTPIKYIALIVLALGNFISNYSNLVLSKGVLKWSSGVSVFYKIRESLFYGGLFFTSMVLERIFTSFKCQLITWKFYTYHCIKKARLTPKVAANLAIKFIIQ